MGQGKGVTQKGIFIGAIDEISNIVYCGKAAD